ncbi:PQQ-binding-like beta-propeller repeat protein [Rhabdothermincola salaria]|uniref:outer membrane protein assembly factor BamB family protein n=1 Tax=Rhabdothermincola salaria TaxID=2903142 RepID=UPI001E4947EC|nr:PQQ-binding-like beta-propeller repeat protein [Rhabdothermincola salaria]MCD9625453.1 PQQ-binding-like beta-propeller repeat protein [Rhabdothermincola salaria]
MDDPSRPYAPTAGGPRGSGSSRPPWLGPVAVLVALVLVWGGYALVTSGSDDDSAASPPDTSESEPSEPVDVDAGDSTTTTTEAELPPFDGWVNPASSGRMWSEEVPGILTFRGNPTRSFYGQGMPEDPSVLWSYPESGGMCGLSSGATWCGMGWTGQPNVYEKDGRTIVSFGAYDYGVHWLDGVTGETVLPSFKTGDIIKGTVTTDPDGFPLTYTGSRDDNYRIIATDRPGEAVELWRVNAYEYGVQQRWNDDWDSSGLIIDDHLFIGGENSWFYIFKLNRGYDAAGLVTVNPELLFTAPSWDDQLLTETSLTAFSIENSVAISGDTVYFANSAGLIQGFDISGLADGVQPTRNFRFWAGDDIDASIVIDADGYLYVGSEWETQSARSAEVGQIFKLDPRNPDDPLVWSVADQGGGVRGVWGTVALANGVVYADTNTGRVLGIDQMTGEILWEKELGSQTWQSPVVVDDVLVVGDCQGVLHAYDVSDPRVDPPELWTVQLDGCIESTPAVWNGRIYVGARGGKFYAIGDA